MAIRPDDIRITAKAAGKLYNSLKGVVSEALFSENIMKISVTLDSDDVIKVECQPKASSVDIGDIVHVNCLPEYCNILVN